MKKKVEQPATSPEHVSAAINALQKFGLSQGWSVTARKEASGSWQYVVNKGTSKVFVNFHQKSKINVQGQPGSLYTAVNSWVKTYQNELKSTILQPPSVPIASSKPSDRAKTAQSEQEQTADSPAISTISPSSDSTATSHKKSSVANTNTDNLQGDESAREWAFEQIGQQAYSFLSTTIRNIYLSGIKILLTIKENQVQLSNYTSIVIPFAQVYEGFLAQMATRLGVVVPEQNRLNEEPLSAQECLSAIVDCIEHSGNKRDIGLIDTLQGVWHDIHCRVMHINFARSSRYTSMTIAEQDIAMINRAIRRGYEYLVWPDKPKGKGSQGSQPKLSEHESSNISENEATFSQENGSARIGTDESGKSDYFGPLVVAAVYVDEHIEPQLRVWGVRDSKNIARSRILALSDEIKKACPHEVVCIQPEALNDLYNQFDLKINRVLAWGHAQAIIKLRKQVPCEHIITDKFADESFVIEALAEEECQVIPQQRPHAEEDCAVAAASILARAEFVRQMDCLSNHFGITLPTGTLESTIVTAGREIVARQGEPALAKIAKLYIKTTQAILGA